MTVIKPGRQTVDQDNSVVTINEIPIGEGLSHREAYLIMLWLQTNMSELISAINHLTGE